MPLTTKQDSISNFHFVNIIFCFGNRTEPTVELYPLVGAKVLVFLMRSLNNILILIVLFPSNSVLLVFDQDEAMSISMYMTRIRERTLCSPLSNTWTLYLKVSDVWAPTWFSKRYSLSSVSRMRTCSGCQRGRNFIRDASAAAHILAVGICMLVVMGRDQHGTFRVQERIRPATSTNFVGNVYNSSTFSSTLMILPIPGKPSLRYWCRSLWEALWPLKVNKRSDDIVVAFEPGCDTAGVQRSKRVEKNIHHSISYRLKKRAAAKATSQIDQNLLQAQTYKFVWQE